MSPGPGRFPRVRCPFEMLPILTALVVGGGQTLVLRSHLDLLAPIAADVPARGGNTGGFWGLTRGIGVVVAGGALVLARGWAGLGSITEGPGVVVGLLLWTAGWAVLVRSQRLGFHDHPHVHPHTSHEHIHAHVGADQTHDHARPGWRIADGALAPSNLAGVLPALAFEVNPAILYLVTYLAASIVSMSVFGYWLGHSRRRGDDPGWLSQARSATAGAALVVGTIWVIEYWPFT
jgi:hypothetical protein